MRKPTDCAPAGLAEGVECYARDVGHTGSSEMAHGFTVTYDSNANIVPVKAVSLPTDEAANPFEAAP